MRKGDMRRQAILDVAERLFYGKGYEHTSVQDVLDEMSISKGGFYHHFDSKLKLLEAICKQRSEGGYEKCEHAVLACTGNAVDKLNILFEHGFFFGQDSMDFMGLMMRMIYRGGCVQLKYTLHREHIRLYLPLMTRIVHQGIAEKLFYNPDPDAVARILLLMNNCMTDEVAEIISNAEQENAVLPLLELVRAYRRSVELLLNAPYGSVQLLELERAIALIRENQMQAQRYDV